MGSTPAVNVVVQDQQDHPHIHGEHRDLYDGQVRR
mgnify:CR=1 FL=1